MTTYEITFNEKTTFGKNLLSFFEENKKNVKVKYPTLMTKKEFEAKCARGVAQFERGECTKMLPNETFDDFLKRI